SFWQLHSALRRPFCNYGLRQADLAGDFRGASNDSRLARADESRETAPAFGAPLPATWARLRELLRQLFPAALRAEFSSTSILKRPRTVRQKYVRHRRRSCSSGAASADTSLSRF